MKQHAKRFFAFLLTIATVATVLVTVPTAAAATPEENVLPNGWKVVTENFENQFTISSANATDLKKDQTFDTGSIFSTGASAQVQSVSVVADPTDATNKALKVETGTLSRYNILPKDFASNYYNVTFDLYWNLETNNIYNGFYLCHDGLDGNWLFQVTDSFVRSYCGDDANNPESGSDKDGVANSKRITTFDADPAKATNYNTWLSLKYVRDNDTFTLKIWEKDNPANVLYEQSRTFACSCGNNNTTPMIRFVQDKNVDAASAWMLIDNLRYENTTGELACVATQTSNVVDGKYAIRFIGTVDSENYEKVGFEIIANYKENGVAKRKRFVLEDCTVFTSILASYGNEVYQAPDLGGKYLIALSIYDIPISYGDITFTVKAMGTAINSDGSTTPVESKTATLLVNKNFVTPQMFGAKGDGVTDDTDAINAAIANAKANGATLKLPEATYYTSKPIDLDSINVQSENAFIKFYGMQASVPAINMQTNVNITGKIRIWTVDNTSVTGNHGGRCAMGFGNYNTGVGAYNCYVEDLEVSGGYYNANGILITGDSSKVTINKITIVGASTIGRGVLIHWGNANDHYPEYVDGVKTNNYLHKEGCDYTKHPHDINLGTVICNDLSNNEGDAAAFYIAGGYNITVDEISASNVRQALTITGGDGGFSYASPVEKAHGSKNVVVKKITATDLTSCGIYYTVESSYNDIPIFYGELTLGTVNLSYGSSYAGQGPAFNGIGSLLIDNMTLSGLKAEALYLANACENIRIGTLTLNNCQASGDYVFQIENKTNKYPYSTGVGLDGLLVQNLVLNSSNYKYIFTLQSTTKNVHLQNLTRTSSTVSGSIFYAAATVPAANNITVAKSNYGVTLQSGSTCTVTVKTDMVMMGSGETISWGSVAGVAK